MSYKNDFKLDLPVSIRRTNNLPLDDSFIFATIDALQEALDAPNTFYAGHVVFVEKDINSPGGSFSRYYYIDNTGNAIAIPNINDIGTILGANDNFTNYDTDNITAKTSFHTMLARLQINKISREQFEDDIKPYIDDLTGHYADIASPEAKNPSFREGELYCVEGTSGAESDQLFITLQDKNTGKWRFQPLTPQWQRVGQEGVASARFPGSVLAQNLTLYDNTSFVTLDPSQLKFLNNLKEYKISSFKVRVLDAAGPNPNIVDELDFNFDDNDNKWFEWCAGNSSSGFRVVMENFNDDADRTYVRYLNSFLVAQKDGDSDSYVPLEINGSSTITDNAIYYCIPADALPPVRNVYGSEMSSTNVKINWTNPTTNNINIGSIKIVYRDDRYPQHEDDVKLYPVDDNGEIRYEVDPSRSGEIICNTNSGVIPTSYLESGAFCSTEIFGLKPGTLYYFYVTPGTKDGFYTVDDAQTCVYSTYDPSANSSTTFNMPRPDTQSTGDDTQTSTSHSALETLLGV